MGNAILVVAEHDNSQLKSATLNTLQAAVELKAQGANILCWTVTSPAQEAQAREVAENITFEQYLAQHPA